LGWIAFRLAKTADTGYLGMQVGFLVEPWPL
jgi:hypothetical protein